MRNLAPRRLLSRLLKDSGLDEPQRQAAERADHFVDEALGILNGAEEPSLRDWLLDDEELITTLQTQTVALYALILRHLNQEQVEAVAWERVLLQIDTLTFRLVCAVAVAAAMRERPKVKEALL